MGARLAEFFARAAQIGGQRARTRLAVLTLIPADKAHLLPDSPDYIEKFEAALRQITQENE